MVSLVKSEDGVFPKSMEVPRMVVKGLIKSRTVILE
jgi:hypothetical protein